MSSVCGWCVCGGGVGGCWCVGWICIAHVWSLTLFPILIFQRARTELNFFDENMNTKAFFPCHEESNLILRTGRENQIFYIGVFHVKTMFLCGKII